MKVYLSSKGIRPDIDNATIINRTIERAKDGDTLHFPAGWFPVGSTIIQRNRVNWYGDETTLRAVQPMTLAHFVGHTKYNIEGFTFKGHYDLNPENPHDFPGVIIEAMVRMTNCTIRNMWGNGLSVTADIHTSTGGNASASRYDNIDLIENKGHGMYFQGGDANQCGIYHADARDNMGAGFYDNSFLGNQFFGCMTHNNKGGSYMATDPNNRAGFYGCYCENDQPAVYLAGAACWFGGLPSQGVIVASPWARVFSYSSVLIKQP